MSTWSAEVEARYAGASQEEIAEKIDQALEDLADRSPAASYGSETFSLRFAVEGSPEKAVFSALETFEHTVRAWGLREPLELQRVELQTEEALEREIQRPNIPELVGVAEIAEILGVTKQRISELARGGRFPRPVAELASGPVWARPTVEHYIEEWPRRPGRPSRAVEAAAQLARGEITLEEAAELLRGASREVQRHFEELAAKLRAELDRERARSRRR